MSYCDECDDWGCPGHYCDECGALAEYANSHLAPLVADLIGGTR